MKKKKNIKPMFWPTEIVIILMNKDNKTCKTYVTTIKLPFCVNLIKQLLK